MSWYIRKKPAKMLQFQYPNQPSTIYKRPITLGLLRETYSKWERRAPICPSHVQELLTSGNIKKVLVQPSSTRIFSNEEYCEAGANVQEDLSEANVVLGIKTTSQQQVLENKTLLLFAHVIKGNNIPFLIHALHDNTRFIDYECITAAGSSNQRLVAFGEHAGMAGMMDILQGLGQQLLLSGINGTSYSTPFLCCPRAYMHRSINDALTSVAGIGNDILSSSHATPPLIFAFTGKGNVTQGALRVFQKLPVQWISTKEELKHIAASITSGSKKHGSHVYGYMVKPDDIYALKDEQPKENLEFDNSHYRAEPFKYKSIFSQTIAPYINVLINGAYWDERYPRILTKKDIHELYKQGKNRLIAIADISCDINGSIEFLEKTTSVEHPFFHYDPITAQIYDQIEASHNDDGKRSTIIVLGVDILPTELAKESSQHFGNALLPLLKCIHMTNKNELCMPLELERACITEGGNLKPRYNYLSSFIHKYRKQEMTISSTDHHQYSILLSLEGHLFDSGLINRALDIMESHVGCYYDIRECAVGQSEGKKSSLLIRLQSNKKNELLDVIPKKIELLAQMIVGSETIVKTYYGWEGEKQLQTQDIIDTHVAKSRALEPLGADSINPKENVLILGAGRVSASVAEYMGRTSRRHIVVASEEKQEVAAIARHAVTGQGVVLDVLSKNSGLSNLVDNADIVISLLPANMHPRILEECIRAGKNLVTASYAPTQSEHEPNLHDQCQKAGITMLNEMGLDPGIDHLMVMRIVNSIRGRGGKVKSFVSVCGGLPATEYYHSNPLRYKFSWSPVGAMKALDNPAIYRCKQQTVEISGSKLLSTAFPVKIWPDLPYGLECYPNRDSLKYGVLYGISEEADTVFRGTLRYRGFCAIMENLKNFGLLENVKAEAVSWGEQIDKMVSQHGCSSLLDCLSNLSDPESGSQGADFLHWLGLLSSEEALTQPESLMLSFCQVLDQRLRYENDEFDMVLMHHDIHATFDDGSVEAVHSNLKLCGDTNMSAMCKTVGYTTAIGAEMILNNKISQKGLITPLEFTDAQCNEILRLLQEEGIQFEETVLLEEFGTFSLPMHKCE